MGDDFVFNINVFFVLGGSILSIRCVEIYEIKTAFFSLFGISLWYFF